MKTWNVGGVEIGLVQNRIAVSAACLSALFFSGSFSLSLFQSGHSEGHTDYRVAFAHIGVAIVLGVVLFLVAIASFLLSEQVQRTDNEGRFFSAFFWFSLGQVALFIGLAMSLSAGLTELVYGLAQVHQGVAAAMAWGALVLWLFLLWVAPLLFLRRCRGSLTACTLRFLVGFYVFCLLASLSICAEVYRAREQVPFTWSVFAQHFFEQVVQPLGWSDPW